MTRRTSRISWLVGCVVVAAVAGFLALDPILFHGFAPACSDGYAEANGTAACKPEWDVASPYLLVLGLALIGTTVAARSLGRDRSVRAEVRSQPVS